MTKIAIIGAGGYVFPLRLVGDLLSFPELRGSTLSLMDVDLAGAERTGSAARELAKHHGFPTRVETTDDRRRALDGADYVIVTFQVGGIEAYRHDVEIPRTYGLDQCVGDTLGPGGVFRFLRSAPAYREIAEDMGRFCPGALLINYANPMAMNCWYLTRLGIETVGLCHSVQGTSRMLARHLGVAYEEVRFRCAGINHQAWFTEFRRADGQDLYPRLREVMKRTHLPRREAASSTAGAHRPHPKGPGKRVPGTRHPAVSSTEGVVGADDRGEHSEAARGASVYEGAAGVERVRTEIMAAFGYFHTESSHHASEYVPYFRKSAGMVEEFIPRRWDYFQICAAHDETGRTEELLARLKEKLEPSVEYGALIVNAAETGRPTVIYGNVQNRRLIPNLPEGCCVELACLVDGNGVQPTTFGPLPPQCATVNRTNVNVQELAVTAALTGRKEHVYHAVQLDPLTGALLTLEQIRAMVDELLAAHARWLPDFA